MPPANAQRILVIDDDVSIGRAVCEVLTLRHFKAISANDLFQARDALHEDDDIGIILVDCHLGGIAGVEVIEALTKEFPRPLAFIMMTADETQAVAVDTTRAQAVDVLTKPIDGKSIEKAVQRAIAKREGEFTDEDIGAPSPFVCEKFLQERMRLKQMPKQWHNLIGDIAAGTSENYIQLLQNNPVDVGALLRQLLSAMERTAEDRQLHIKFRMPVSLPLVYADNTGLSFGIHDIAVFMTSAMEPGDGLTLTALREDDDLILSFHVHSANMPFEALSVLAANPSTIDVGNSKTTLLGARLVVELHRGHFRIEKRTDDDILLRMFIPIARADTRTTRSKLAVFS